MIRDFDDLFDDLCPWRYVLISDLFAPLAAYVARPGPAPAGTDAELITMAIVGECCGWDQETVLLSRWRDHRDLFPQQPERSRFNRRRRDLAPVINLLRQAVVQTLDFTQDTQCIIDSLPVPVVQFYYLPQASVEWKGAAAAFGHCCSKKPAIFGYTLHLLLTQSGGIRDFELAPANLPDLTVGSELLAEHTDLQVLGDKGYISQSVARSPSTCAPSATSRSSRRRAVTSGVSPRGRSVTCTRICASSSRPSTLSAPSSSTSKPIMRTVSDSEG